MGWEKFITNGAKIIKSSGKLLSSAGHGTVKVAKVAAPIVGKTVTATAKGGFEVSKAVGKATLKNPLVAGAAFLYMKKEDGEGIISAASREIFDQDAINKGGLLGGVKCAAFGKDNAENSLAENVTDIFMGEGTYQGVKDNVRQASHFIRNSVVPGQQSQVPGTSMQEGQLLYDANSNVVGTYPRIGLVNSQQLSAMRNANPFSSVGDFIKQTSGGKVTGLNVVEIMAAAYMMFGSRFGWLGKIAGALIGGMAAKDITGRSAMIQHQQAMTGGYGLHPPYPQHQYVSQYPHQQEQSQEEYTVSRGRGL